MTNKRKAKATNVMPVQIANVATDLVERTRFGKKVLKLLEDQLGHKRFLPKFQGGGLLVIRFFELQPESVKKYLFENLGLVESNQNGNHGGMKTTLIVSLAETIPEVIKKVNDSFSQLKIKKVVKDKKSELLVVPVKTLDQHKSAPVPVAQTESVSEAKRYARKSLTQFLLPIFQFEMSLFNKEEVTREMIFEWGQERVANCEELHCGTYRVGISKEIEKALSWAINNPGGVTRHNGDVVVDTVMWESRPKKPLNVNYCLPPSSMDEDVKVVESRIKRATGINCNVIAITVGGYFKLMFRGMKTSIKAGVITEQMGWNVLLDRGTPIIYVYPITKESGLSQSEYANAEIKPSETLPVNLPQFNSEPKEENVNSIFSLVVHSKIEIMQKIINLLQDPSLVSKLTIETRQQLVDAALEDLIDKDPEVYGRMLLDAYKFS